MNLTDSEKKFIETYGEQTCIDAYNMHMKGNGGNTVGEEFLYGTVSPSFYTIGGDILINAGRKLSEGGSR